MPRLDYANARVAARRSRLLGAAALHELLARPTLEGRVELLREMPIGADLPRPLAGPDPLAAVEASLRASLRREALRIVAGAEGATARALLGAFLSLGDAGAVKAVARGVAAGARLDRVLSAAPFAPAFPEPLLRTAASSATVDEATAVLAPASPVARAAREARAAGTGGLVALEIAADRAAFAGALAACARPGEDAAVLGRHLADRIDARNAATLLVLAGEAPAADAWISGGRRLGGASFRALAGAAPEAVRAAVAGALGVPPGALVHPASADRALEQAVARALRREARARPLSIAVPLAYLADRAAEIRRVAVVLRGAEMGLAGEEILDLAEA